jgi:hypothetical protein
MVTMLFSFSTSGSSTSFVLNLPSPSVSSSVRILPSSSSDTYSIGTDDSVRARTHAPTRSHTHTQRSMVIMGARCDMPRACSLLTPSSIFFSSDMNSPWSRLPEWSSSASMKSCSTLERVHFGFSAAAAAASAGGGAGAGAGAGRSRGLRGSRGVRAGRERPAGLAAAAAATACGVPARPPASTRAPPAGRAVGDRSRHSSSR